VSLEAAARTSNLEKRICFTGQISDVRPFYELADVFVLPSHSEGSPNVLLEAMAAEVPVVATTVGGVPEIVENETSALLTAPNDPPAMAKAIGRLLTDVELGSRIKRNSKALVVKNHSPQSYVRSLIQTYQNVIEERR
jgi:glycosyltransferase involved in cell wall biosynthesis